MQTLDEVLRPALEFPNATRGLREEALREEVIPLAHFEILREQGFEVRRGFISSETSARLMVTLRHPTYPRTYRVETQYRKDGNTETTVYPDGKPLNGSGPTTPQQLRDLVFATAESILRQC